MSDVTRLIFPQIDDVILERKIEDNELVEPKFYIPIIPTILLNGIDGIGNGWSTKIPSFNPLDLINATIETLKTFSNKSPKISSFKYLPWYRNWNGKVFNYLNQWEFVGIVEKVQEDEFIISEIPIDMSIDNLRSNMNGLIQSKILKDYIDMESREKNKKSYSLDTLRFKLKFYPDKVKDENDVISLLKLSSSISKNNLVAFTPTDKIRKYENITSIFAEWFIVRFNHYIKRKNYILENMKKDLLILENKFRFIKDNIDNQNKYFDGKKSKDILKSQLNDEKYDLIDDSFDYLLKLPMYSMTKDKIDKLTVEIINKKKEIESYQNTSIKKIWYDELLKLKKFIIQE